MDKNFPPLLLQKPETRKSRGVTGKPRQLPTDVQARIHEIAKLHRLSFSKLSRKLGTLTDEQRAAVFYRLESERPLSKRDIIGTGLIGVAQPRPETIFAMPKESNLERLIEKINQFEESAGSGVIKNAWFAYLSSFKQADPKERLSDQFRSEYSRLVRRKTSFLFEVELYVFDEVKSRRIHRLHEWVSELGKDLSPFGGSLFEREFVGSSCRVVVQANGAGFRTIVTSPKWIERVRAIEGRPNYRTFEELRREFNSSPDLLIQGPRKDAPIVCVIDSGISNSNPLLRPVIVPNLQISFLKSDSDPRDHHGHGSAVASLAAYKQINIAQGAENVATCWIANARVMNSSNLVEETTLLSRQLRDAVEYFSRRGVKIFCMAIGITDRVFSDKNRGAFPRSSWLARRIDELSLKHDVLFLIPTGNLTKREITSCWTESNPYPQYFRLEQARLLDPSQAALAITVGSIASSTKIVGTNDDVPIANRQEPSPFTRSGPGIRGEVKPEVVHYGGNFSLDGLTNSVRENSGLGVPVAGMSMNPIVRTEVGTSLACPMVANEVAHILGALQALGIRHPNSTLLKALLVNSARHDRQLTQRSMEASEGREEVARMLIGHGVPDGVRATDCDEFSTLLVYEGEIMPGTVQFFDIPIPEEMSEFNSDYSISITVSFNSKVQPWGLESYFGSSLRWRLFRGDIPHEQILDKFSVSTDEEIESPDEDELVSSLETDDPSQTKTTPGYNERSRGSIQHGIHRWTFHKKAYSQRSYILAVNCMRHWSSQDIPFAVVVRVTDAERKVELYTRIRARLSVRTRVR